MCNVCVLAYCSRIHAMLATVVNDARTGQSIDMHHEF